MAAKPPKHQYENNPFLIASKGIALLFNLGQGVGILFAVISVIGWFANAFSPDNSNSSSTGIPSEFQGWQLNDWLLLGAAVAIISLAVIMIVSLFNGVGAYTSARLAEGDEVSIKTAFQEVFDKLWSFIWLQIIIVVKILLWSLLFIIPGIVMAFRYSLASVAFFDDTKNLRGNAAIKESLRLTKGAWITTYAATVLFNIVSLGIISNIVSVGANAVLYKQFKAVGAKKPPAHWLSWFTLVLPFIILSIAFFVILVIVIVLGLVGGYKTH